MQTLTTVTGNTLPITDNRIEREHPLPDHIDLTVQELFERVETTSWALIAENTAEHSTLSEQQARIHTLERFGLSRQLIAELLEVSPNTIDTHKQALQDKTGRETDDFTDTILHGGIAGYPQPAHSVTLIIHYSPLTVEPAHTPEKLFFVNHDPVNDDTTYIERTTTPRTKPIDEVKQVGGPSLRETESDTVAVKEQAYIEYNDPVTFAFEAMNDVMPADPEAVYDALCALPVFTMRVDEFVERWSELEAKKAEQTLTA